VLRHQRAAGEPLARARRALDGDPAGIQLVEAGDKREQRRLAGAAASDDPDPPLRRHLQIQSLEYVPAAQHTHNTLDSDSADRPRDPNFNE
jgi:hypothetical protein